MVLNNMVFLLSAGQEVLGIYVLPSQSTELLCNHSIIFALHPFKPYASMFREMSNEACKQPGAGEGIGFANHRSTLQKLYPPDYLGPFTVGFWWHAADK